MTTIYNAHHDGDQYRITKFVDGNPESSYLCTHSECECLAGHRDTCRHRQMLPEMIDRGLINSHLFLNWDHSARPTCNFDGMIDPVPAVFANDPWYQFVPAGQHVEEDACPGHVASDHDPKVCRHCGTHIDSLRPADDTNNIDWDTMAEERLGQRVPAPAKPFRRI